MKLMLMAASLRQDSINKKLIQLSHEVLKKLQVSSEIKQFNDYEQPLYDGDVETSKGLPAGVQQFINDMNDFDGLVFSVPEYNFSMPGTFKNLIDWVSRGRPMPWMGKKILLLSASPAAAGGVRGLWQIRVPFEGCGAFVFPDMFTLANAFSAFDDKGHLTDKNLEDRLEGLLKQFASFSAVKF
jgi:NAD(P)H-dependent FMN reductase